MAVRVCVFARRSNFGRFVAVWVVSWVANDAVGVKLWVTGQPN